MPLLDEQVNPSADLPQPQIMLDSDLVRGALGVDPVASVLSSIGAFVERVPAAKYKLTRVIVMHTVTPGVVTNWYASDGIPEVGLHVCQVRPDGKGEVFQSDSAGHAQFNWGRESAFSNAGGGPFSVFAATSAERDPESNMLRVGDFVSDHVSSLGDFKAEHLQVYLQFVEGGAAPPTPGAKLELRGVIVALTQMHMALDSLISEIEKLNTAAL